MYLYHIGRSINKGVPEFLKDLYQLIYFLDLIMIYM